MEEKFVNRKYNFLKLLFLFVYIADALYYSYTSLFLSSLEFKEGIIGVIASITTITYLVVNPIWNIFAKNNKIIKYMLMGIALASGVIIILYGNASTVEVIMLLTGMLACVIAPFYSLLDSHATVFCNKYNKEYSNIRVMGSIAYIIGSGIGGVLVDYIGYSNMFIISGAIFILCSIFILFLKTEPKVKEEQKRDFKAILKNKWFYAYSLFYLFLVTLNNVGDSFVPLLFSKIKGLSASDYGFIAALFVFVEVVVMFILAKYFRKIRDLYLLILVVLGYFLKTFLLSFTNLPTPVLIVAACFRGVGWGTLLFVHMKYLVKLVGIHNVTSASLVLVFFSSVFQFLGSNLFGYLFENIGYDFSFRLISILNISVGALFIVSRFIFERASSCKYLEEF